MIFTTLKFLVFFISTVLIYYITPKNKRWIVLLLASMYFYMCASVKYSIFLILASLITYFGAIFIDKIQIKQKKYLEANKEKLSKEEKKEYKNKIEKQKKIVSAISIILTLSMLIFMKYTNFAIENISKILNLLNLNFNTPIFNFILPLGISFYTFMSIGYVIDVYRGNYSAEKNFFKYFLFVSYFPHILQGPMDKYDELSKEIFIGKNFEYENAIEGTYRAIIGVIKKMVLADKLSIVVNGVLANPAGFFGINVFIAIILYAIQLYADFSGYMDIAIGTSKILGIRIAENFDAPYFSKSIAEYWRRWHISLGAWFRDYVYYPILRSKASEKIRKYYKNKNNKFLSNNMPTVFALAILWTLIGFWHGSTWAFIIYGMYHGSIIIISTLLSGIYDKFHKKFSQIVKSKIYSVFQIIRTFLLVLIGYFLFCTGKLSIAILLFKNMFNLNSEGINIIDTMTKDTKISVIIGFVILLILDILQIKKINIYSKFRKLPICVRWGIYIIGIFILIMFASGEAQEFLYFQF